jgi:hypothetical protein
MSGLQVNLHQLNHPAFNRGGNKSCPVNHNLSGSQFPHSEGVAEHLPFFII